MPGKVYGLQVFFQKIIIALHKPLQFKSLITSFFPSCYLISSFSLLISSTHGNILTFINIYNIYIH